MYSCVVEYLPGLHASRVTRELSVSATCIACHIISDDLLTTWRRTDAASSYWGYCMFLYRLLKQVRKIKNVILVSNSVARNA